MALRRGNNSRSLTTDVAAASIFQELEMEKGALMRAAALGDLDKIANLLHNGAKINENYVGRPPLIAAVIQNQEAAVRLLLSEGASVNIVDIDGRTPLIWACICWHDLSIINTLLTSGADVLIQDERGNSPLHEASMAGSVEASELLLRHGADLNVVDKADRKTALHAACGFGKTESVEYLLRCGIDHSLQDEDGNTALHIACIADDIKSAEILIRNGADFSIRNNIGDTALECYREDNEILKAIIEEVHCVLK